MKHGKHRRGDPMAPRSSSPCRHGPLSLLTWCFAALWLPAVATRANAQTVDTLRARAITTAGAPLAGATMLATPVGTAATIADTADADGRLAVTVPHDDAPVLVILRSTGLQDVRRTVTRTGSLTDLGDVTLAPAPATQLPTVKVRERRRPRPPRTDGSSTDPAAAQAGSPLVSGLSGDVTGDLSLLAATIPGISVTRDEAGNITGYSALGLSPDQNVTTLQGIRTSAGSLPRDAAVNTRVVLTTFDPARGGFSGAQTAIQVLPGSRYSSRSLHLTLDAPALQLTDPLARQLGQTPTNAQLSGLLSGPLRDGHVLYNASMQLGLVSRASPAFAPGHLAGAAAVGADPARVESALATAERYGLGAAPAPDRRDGNGAALLRLDLQPGGSWTGNVIASGRWRESSRGYASPLTVRGSAARLTSSGADVVATMSRYVHQVVLNETRVGLGWSASKLASHLAVPEVQVLTLGQATDSGQGIAPLRFGGLSGISGTSRSRSLEANNETSWSTLDAHHRIRLTLGGRADKVRTQRLSDPGLFTYESEEAFDANQPSSFSRFIGAEHRDVSVGTLNASAADTWTPTPRVRVQYGLRLDGVAAPALDNADDALRTRFALASVGARHFGSVSPRASMTWAYGSRTRLLGMGAEPRGTLRAGLGLFQEVPAADDFIPFATPGDALRAEELRCVGSSVPIPDWAAIEQDGFSVPACTSDPLLAQRAPDVSLLASSFRSPASRRASVGWTGGIGGGWQADAELILSSTRGLPGVQDVNFADIAQRTLADDGRPIFAPAGAIDSASGRVSLAGSRADDAYGQVRVTGSDLAARATQLTIRLAPEASYGMFDVNFAYTLASYRSQTNGFRGTTAGDPRVVEWGRAPGDSRHQFNVIGTAFLPKGITASLWGRISSGLPYTPVVSGDLNGDGLLNDRAFVPANGGDDARATALATLIASAPDRVRDCLSRNRGVIADRGSCEGPWSSQLNAQLRFRAPALLHSNRLTAVLTFVNVPAALDYALHGSNPAGWGQGGVVDPVLWRATAYSPGAGEFTLQANPGFGRRLSARSGLRAPFQLTLDFRVALGPPRVEQIYRRSITASTKAVGAESADSMARFNQLLDELEANFPNTPKEILRIGDSLHLTPAQVQRLGELRQRYDARSDEIWTPVVKLLLANPPREDHHAASLRALRNAEDEAADLVIELAIEIRKVVTPEQIRRMHPLFAVLLDEHRVRDLLVRPF